MKNNTKTFLHICLMITLCAIYKAIYDSWVAAVALTALVVIISKYLTTHNDDD